MHKFSFSRSSSNIFSNSLINFAITILVLLIAFNLGWLIAFVQLYAQPKIVGNLDKIIFHLQSILLLGNLSILLLFIGYIGIVKYVKSILGKRY